MGDFSMAPFGGGATMGMEGGGTLAADLAARSIPYAIEWVTKHLLKRGEQSAARQVDKLMGINKRVSKFRRRQFTPRLPRYAKGLERVTGVYGRFKPSFGKELKFKDFNFTALGIRDAWINGVLVSLIDKGTGPTERIGRNYTIRSLQFRFSIKKVSTISNAIVRVVIILDKQTNGESFTGEDLFVDGITAAATTWTRYRNLENISRFEILWDKTYYLDAKSRTGSGAIASSQIVDSYYKKVNIPVHMKDTTPSTLTDIQDNSIVVLFCGDLVGTTDLTWKGTFRIRFTG